MNRITALGTTLLTIAATIACSAPAAPSTPTQVPVTGAQSAASPTSVAAAASPTAPANRTPTTSTASIVTFQIVQPTEARFRAQETLANRPLPNTAVGTTTEVTGTIALNGTQVVPGGASIIVDVASLATDQRPRDNYIKANTLEASKYPSFKFVPKEITGLTALPASGEQTFKLSGDLTVKDVTKPVTWDVTATFAPQQVTGLATTTITFSNFGMQPPKTAVVLSVEDEIKLELQFTAARQGI